MDQILKVDLNLLYYIQQERLNNEIVEKIIWNNSINLQLDSLLFNDDEIQVLGLYGTLESVSLYLKERLGLSVEASQDVKNYEERGMITFTNYQRDFFLIYLGPDEYFTKDKFEESIEITLYRYLKDLCQKILLLPSKKILKGWKNLNNHFYQDSDNIVQEFEIKKIDEAQLDIVKLKIEVKNEDIRNLQQLLNGQGQQRCVNHNTLKVQQNPLSESQLKDYFLKIVKNQSLDIQTLNLDQYQDQFKYQVRFRLKDYQKQINSIIKKMDEHSYKEVRGWCINFYKSEIKKNQQIFDIVHEVITQQILEQIGLYFIEDVDPKKIEKQIKSRLYEYNHTKQEASKLKYQDLLSVQKEYLKIYNDLFQSQDPNSIPNLWKQFWKQVQIDYLDIIQQYEIKLQYQLYEFKVIRSLKAEQQFIIMEELFCQLLDLQELKNVNPEQLTIKYYFTSSNKGSPQLLLLNINQGQYEYIWAIINNQQLQEIFRIKQNISLLKFYYNIQNTTMYIFNTKIGITIIQYNEDRRVIKSEKNIENKLYRKVIDICYLPFFETFILLSSKHQLYKWHIDTKEFVAIKIEESQQSYLQQCQRLFTSGFGNYYCMANQYRLDIVNFNNQIVKTLEFIDLLQEKMIDLQHIQLFSDSQDWFLVYLDQNNSQVHQIKNLSNQQKIVAKKQIDSEIKFTNSYLDLIKGSLIKYGPSNYIFETTPQKTQIYIKKEFYNVLESYIKLLDLQQSEDLIIKLDITHIDGHQIISRSLGFLILSRTSIQICTVEKSQLIPLSNGIFQDNISHQIRILDKVNSLSFGLLEKILCLEDNKNIFIVSIMGRQSSGKSYLLNRIFGTRFGVSSARCTDGIWMSVSKILNTTFVILDCEGLFSTRRTQDEETMLLSFLSGISDITILNQDLTFSRNLNDLFQNLSKSIEQIRGDKLFKGKLMIAVRDVNLKEKDNAQKELIRNIDLIKNNQQTGNFLTVLFNDQFQTILMSYFDNRQFDNDILQIRQELLSNSNNIFRWDNPQQLLRSMKIMLIQLELKDHRSLEDHELDFIIKNLSKKTKDYWILQKQEQLPELNLVDQSSAYQMLLNYSYYQVQIDRETIYFNSKLKSAEDIIQDILKLRLEETLQYLYKDLNTIYSNKINDEKIQKAIQDVKQQLQDQAGQYLICQQKCSQCFLSCNLKKDHLESDQLDYKELLQDQIKEIDNRLLIIQSTLMGQENLEQIQIEIQLLRQQEIENETFISLKQCILAQEENVSLIQSYLRCSDYSQENFQLNLKTHINKRLIQINLGVLQESIEQEEQFDNLLSQNDIRLIQTSSQKKEQKQLLINFEQNIEKIKISTAYQERFQLTNKMQSLINQIKEDYEEIDCHKGQMINLQNQLNRLQNENISAVDQYNIAERLQFLEQQQKQEYDNSQKMKAQYLNKFDEIKSEINKYGIEKYLEDKIEGIEETIQEIESKVSFKRNKQSQKTQQKQEQYKMLENENLCNEQIKKINDKLNNLDKDIEAFQNEIMCLLKQLKDENINYKKLQLIKSNILDQDQNNSSQQINEIPNEIIKILFNYLISEQKEIELKLREINNSLSESKIIEQLQLLKQQICQHQIKINSKELCNSQNQLQLNIINDKLDLLNKQILEEKQSMELCQQQVLIIKNKMESYEFQEKQFQEIGSQLKTIRNELVNAKQLNYQIDQQSKLIDTQSSGVDLKMIRESDLSSFQTRASKITQDLNGLMDNLQNITKLNELHNDRKIKQKELQDIELNLSKQHNCGRKSHLCDQICQCCKDPQTMCQYLAGHSNELESHLCLINSHYCKQQCQVKNCDSYCQYQFNHSKELKHQCSALHVCLEKCSFCHKICKLSNLIEHSTHQCEQIKCSKLCYFNQNYFNEDKKCINSCNRLHNEIHEHHVCSNQAHQCQNKCEQQGICQISTYTEIIKEWKTKNGSIFPYKIYKQNSEIMQCYQKVEQQQLSHDGAHHCNEVHICDQRCPECFAFCTLKMGHEGKHQPHLHRNKEQQIFTALEGSDYDKLQIQLEGQTREYQIGDSCEPETCLTSCTRRSRAHYHLLECKGGTECAELRLKKFAARHQKTKYKGSDKLYDEILCDHFWNHLGWENPVETSKRKEIPLCNYYCNYCKGQELQFCIKEAWHTESSKYQDHVFSCAEKHKIQGLDICFIIDTTNSMDKYIEMVKKLISHLMMSTKKYFEKDQQLVRTAIISYKDHCDKQVVQNLDFTNYDEAKKFLDVLKADGGGDGPEAMLDGLNEIKNLKWAEKSKRFVFLVADCPPHGNPKFHNFQDDHPKGCPCGLDEQQVLNQLKAMNIEFFIQKLNDYLDQTIGIFKKIMPTITAFEKGSQQEFVNLIDKLICTELDIREITLNR